MTNARKGRRAAVAKEVTVAEDGQEATEALHAGEARETKQVLASQGAGVDAAKEAANDGTTTALAAAAPPPPPAPPGPAAEWIAVSELQEWAGNPRKIPQTAVKKVARSIESFGFAAPIVARQATRDIIAGHTRFRAAKLLGLHYVPVRFMDLSEKDARLLCLADNRTHEETDWDEDKLAVIIREMKEQAADLSAAGFDTFELADMLKVGEALNIGAPRMDRADDIEPWRFRVYKLSISKETGARLDEIIRQFGEDRGTYNGFVEYLIACLERGVDLPPVAA